MAVLYAALAGTSTTSDLYTVDPATGAMTPVGPIGFAVTGLAFDPTTATLYGLTSPRSTVHPSSFVGIDPTTGAGTWIAAETLNTPQTDLDFTSGGQCYAMGQNLQLILVDKATGADTLIGGSGTTIGGGLAISPLTGVAYLHNQGNLYTVDLATGAKTLVAATGGNTINALSFGAGGVLWGVEQTSSTARQLVTINLATGVTTPVGAMTSLTDALAWSPGPPEPSLAKAATTPIAAGAYTKITLTVTNPTAAPVTVTEFRDTLPTGFLYLGGASGATTADAVVAGQVLTWPGSFAVPATGSLALSFWVRADTATPGAYTNLAAVVITAVGTRTASKVITVSGAYIALSPTRGKPGDFVAITGGGFSATRSITATFNGTAISLSGTTTTDASGSFTGTSFTVPTLPPGIYTVTVTDALGVNASAEFTICRDILYDGIAAIPTFSTPAYLSGVPQWDMIAQQNQPVGGNESGLQAGSNGDQGMRAIGCEYGGGACFAWAEQQIGGQGVYIGTYDGTTFTLLGGPFDAGGAPGAIALPVVATDGSNLYLAYRKSASFPTASSSWLYEVWKYDGAVWSHLYSSGPSVVQKNDISSVPGEEWNGSSGPKLSSSAAEPGAVYVGWKESGREAVDPSFQFRSRFTVIGLGAATVPGETLIYDDTVYSTGWPTISAADAPVDWFGHKLEFQLLSDGGFPVVIWNAPGAGATDWLDNEYHMLRLDTMTDLFTWASLIGTPTYGTYYPMGTIDLGGNNTSFAPVAVSANTYVDPYYAGAPVWIVLLKFAYGLYGYPGAPPPLGQAFEWRLICVRTDGSGWHKFEDSDVASNGLTDSDTFTAAVSLWSEDENLWLFCSSTYRTGSGGGFFDQRYSRLCPGWIKVVPFPVPSNEARWPVLMGDDFRYFARTADLDPLVGSSKLYAACYHRTICRDCQNCGCGAAGGLHVWQRFTPAPE